MGLREKKKKDLDDKIRSVSREVFLAKGYAQATVEEIAEKAEIGIGSLYNYFPSKADIFIAIMSKELQLDLDDESQLEIDLERDVSSSVLELLNPLLRTTKFLGKKIWRELMSVAFSNSKTNTFLAKGMMKLDYRFIDRIEKFLETQKKRGKLSATFDPHQAAYAVYGCAMAQFMIYLYQDEIEFETFARNVRDQIVFLFEGKSAPPQP